MTKMTLGLDVSKRYLDMVAMDAAGSVVERKRHTWTKLLDRTAAMTPVRIGLEAGGGAHHLGRRLQAQGHEVRLMPPQHVRAYVKGNKTDSADAEACAEAAQRPTMRFVPIKSCAQQELQALQRIRRRLIEQRTAVINQIRGLLREFGLSAPKGHAALSRRLPDLLAEAQREVSPELIAEIEDLRAEWSAYDHRVSRLEDRLHAQASQDDGYRRLREIDGIGLLTASAVVAAVGDARNFNRGRDFAAWLGLTPKEHTTGGKQRLLSISKRGQPELRTLFVHAARSVLLSMARRTGGTGPWLRQLMQRRHRNVAIVALANKLARIAWAVLAKGERYRPQGA
jgi:transposase